MSHENVKYFYNNGGLMLPTVYMALKIMTKV